MIEDEYCEYKSICKYEKGCDYNPFCYRRLQLEGILNEEGKKMIKELNLKKTMKGGIKEDE